MNPAQDEAAAFAERRDREERRYYARRPKKIGDVLAQLITLRGYGRFQADDNLEQAWQAAVGESLGRATRAGRIRRGNLGVTVTNSTVVHELTFRKQQILAELARRLPEARIRDLRFRVGTIE